jgi:hypothetical protein
MLADAQLKRGQLAAARLELPEGATWKRADLDHLRAELGEPVPEGDRTLRWAALQLRSRSVRWAQIAVLGQEGSAWTVRTDSLGIQWRGRDLAAEQPFLVRVDSTNIELRGLSLRGSLGQVIGEGTVQADSAQAEVRVALDLPEGPAPFGLTVPWPDSLRLRIASSANDRLDLGLYAPGLRLGPDGDLQLHAELHAPADSLRASLELLRPDRSPMLSALAHAPLRARSVPWDISLRAKALALRADLQSVPLPSRVGAPRQVWNEFLARRGPNPLRVDGQLRVDGLPAIPVGTVELGVRLPEGTPMETHTVDVDARMEGDGNVSSTASWRNQSDEIARAQLSLRPEPSAGEQGKRSLDATVMARSIQLAELEWMLPAGISLDGLVDLEGSAKGMLDEPQLSGTLDADDVEIRLSDGTLARADAHLELQPGGKRPQLTGRVDVQSALLTMPESQRNLYPATGQALLWESMELDAMRAASEDSLSAENAAMARAGISGPPEEPFADIDIVVRIPPNVRLIGRRLEVEMGGQLRLRVSEGRPTLMGELTAHRGHLDLLGNRFTLSQGTVTFYGEDEVNPVLNLVLETTKDQVTVRVIIEGTALKPRIRLESSPAMAEADIMSHLLFGSDSNSLDGFQAEWVRTQALQLSQMLGLDVERVLSQGLGLDVVRIGRSQRDPEVQALTAGKYIDPKVLLTYEQSLTRSESFYVILRWWITRDITLETNVGNVDPSNVQINWRRRY